MKSSPKDSNFMKFHSLYRQSEEELVPHLLSQIGAEGGITSEHLDNIHACAHDLISAVRAQKIGPLSIENFLQTYDLGSPEGIALLCLTEAYLRIPDSHNKTALIRDKVGSIHWADHYCKANSITMNLATFGLSATEHLLNQKVYDNALLSSASSLSRKVTEPVIRQGIHEAMKVMGYQFVLGETIEEALKKARIAERRGYLHSFDMLGEGAETAEDAERYYKSYEEALKALAGYAGGDFSQSICRRPSLSIKLSAIHPRYELSQKKRVFNELFPKIYALCQKAKASHLGLTIDAEESERLELSLEVLEKLCEQEDLKDWQGLGLAVQAYQKRASAVIDWLCDVGHQYQRRFCVRLVKGAYWDTEIKAAQELGLSDYPVFTRKVNTDLSYHLCAQKMFVHPQEIYSQFATHNAYTIATILELAKLYHASPLDGFEFQRLHGMGENLYAQVRQQLKDQVACRIYAPVGHFQDLLAYLVRRFLENGANSSFVNQINDSAIPIDNLLESPIQVVQGSIALQEKHHNSIIPLPEDLLMPTRHIAKGLDLSDQGVLTQLESDLIAFEKTFPHHLSPSNEHPRVSLYDPGCSDRLVSTYQLATADDLRMALDRAYGVYDVWTNLPVNDRATMVENWANLLEQNTKTLMGYLIYEAGKTYKDAISEVREAIDFCRYYALQSRLLMENPEPLPGPTGERNELSLHGRGVFACISPWNFPLAIFVGQIAATLVSGNCVLAKPAQQTPAIATFAIKLAHQAGIPPKVLQLLLTKGSLVSEVLLRDPRVSGVVFTGSSEVGKAINQTLANRPGAIAPLIAETGGINALIVDSSALPEQAVRDIIISAFQSAGQRCSALRLLFIQQDIADGILKMLKGAMEELTVGHPAAFSSDIGPVIDEKARRELLAYVQTLSAKAQLLTQVSLMEENSTDKGSYVAPQAWILESAADLNEEVFGPILHIVTYGASDLPQVIKSINDKGYGLTLGVHSRIDETIDFVRKNARVGNLYVNRSIIGAVVGMQPFGGEGLSGTGPKAGGPHYLLRFMVERTFTQDTTAAGGNATLLAQI